MDRNVIVNDVCKCLTSSPSSSLASSNFLVYNDRYLLLVSWYATNDMVIICVRKCDMLHVPKGMFNETKMCIMHNDGTDDDDEDTNNERKQILCVMIFIPSFFVANKFIWHWWGFPFFKIFGNEWKFFLPVHIINIYYIERTYLPPACFLDEKGNAYFMYVHCLPRENIIVYLSCIFIMYRMWRNYKSIQT